VYIHLVAAYQALGVDKSMAAQLTTTSRPTYRLAQLQDAGLARDEHSSLAKASAPALSALIIP
jgi:hypothetical protein